MAKPEAFIRMVTTEAHISKANMVSKLNWHKFDFWVLQSSNRDHPFQTSANFNKFWPLPPSVGIFYCYPLGRLDKFYTPIFLKMPTSWLDGPILLCYNKSVASNMKFCANQSFIPKFGNETTTCNKSYVCQKWEKWMWLKIEYFWASFFMGRFNPIINE